ncbi:phenylacetate--CoA ligase family protein [Halanaerobium sp. ST460_2HS_T2]|uniref:phenylacetate--CoA ligase family protein n=1 Tax=Halanaerobium sp. ST460_2HS_T2 TaxID=2183914 RepID=UPI000DF13F52|nr:phenylacetate--CoA ligase family protein [Halanaerobium sp. ST460_2HS_T2]RCW53389.1 phenylacetate-CoA ligase [Halanaerobium sp. ST460_2HS_T2]
MKYQKIYDNSPIWFQNVMATLYGFKVMRNRYKEEYYKHLNYLDDIHNLSKEELKELQFQELMSLLKNTIEKSNFYKELYKNIDITSFQSLEDLKKLPIVTKEMLRKNIDNVITISKKNAVEGHTGGTTGKSLVVYFTPEDMQKRMATLDFFKFKNGFKNLKMKRATFMGKHIVPPGQKKKIFWRYNAAAKQMVYSSFHITEENIPYYIESLNKFKPAAIDGFVSSIYDIASYILRNNISINFDLEAVFPTSETVTSEHREVIEKAFNTKVRDQYASSEGAPFVWECEEGNYHYDITSGVIETMENSNEILVTSFTTYGTPLIRYKIGDKMIFEDEDKSCGCGFNTPLVKSIEGRVVDFLYTTEGAKVNLGNIANIFKNMPNIIVKSQLIQDSLNHMLVKLVLEEEFTDNYRQMLIDEIRHKFGSDMQIDFKIVDRIKREKSGKYKLVKNKVAQEDLNAQ